MRLKVIATTLIPSLFWLVACGSDSSDSGDSSLPNCNAECDAQAAGCPASGSDYASTCKQICSAISSKCRAQEETYAACVTPVGFQCSTSVTINGKPAPESKDSTKCTAEQKAYTDCLAG